MTKKETDPQLEQHSLPGINMAGKEAPGKECENDSDMSREGDTDAKSERGSRSQPVDPPRKG